LKETFMTWTPTYFVDSLGLSKAAAADKSAYFSFAGGVSVLATGFLSDRLGRVGRAVIMVVFLFLCTAALGALAILDLSATTIVPVAFVALIGFLLIGPYSFLAGAVSLDFGGKQGASTASGFIDGIGYLGGMLAGDSMARISVAYGWKGAFAALAGVALLSSLAALLFLLEQPERTSSP
jgi:sugar phosphate permease